jgi:hypothetical protein
MFNTQLNTYLILVEYSIQFSRFFWKKNSAKFYSPRLERKAKFLKAKEAEGKVNVEQNAEGEKLNDAKGREGRDGMNLDSIYALNWTNLEKDSY